MRECAESGRVRWEYAEYAPRVARFDDPFHAKIVASRPRAHNIPLGRVFLINKSIRAGTIGEVFLTALMLGLTSFGGPIAHFGYFERTYVQKLQWLSHEQY